MAKPSSPKDIARKNKDIREAVTAELDFDPVVDATNITIKTMNGDVALNGTVPSYPQYVEAAEATRRIDGVTGVRNHLMVMLPATHYRGDPVLTTAANNALAQSVTVPGGVEASARDGDIWLTGMVRFGYQREAAEAAVAGLTGVRHIADDIEILNTDQTQDVTMLVQGALDRYGLFHDDSEIAVAASDGAVTLSGRVRTWTEHDAAIGAAWMGSGVWSVRDELYVTG